MVSDNERTIEIDRRAWPPGDVLEHLRSPELPEWEFWRVMSYAAIAMRDDKDYLSALNEVKRERFKTGFPSLEATTPQNEPSGVPSRIGRRLPLEPQLKRAIGQCKTLGLIWSNSGYAVFYRVMQEDYSIGISRSVFEEKMRQMGFDDCTSGSLDNAFRRNAFLMSKTESWPTATGNNTTKAVKLAAAFRKAIKD